MLTNEARLRYLNQVLGYYADVEAIVTTTAKTANILNMVVLVLSVVTSGSLWIHLSDTLPLTTMWVGAIASTIAAGASLYLKTSGIGKKRTKALELYREIGQFIASLRTSETITEDLIWDRCKEFEHKITEVRFAQVGEG